jgi:hypothetical protein
LAASAGRAAAEASSSQAHREVNKVNQVNKVLTPHSKGRLAVDREPAIPAQLASFGESASEQAASDASDFPLQTPHLKLEEEKITPYGVTTNEEVPATRPAAETLHDRFRETKPICPGTLATAERRRALTRSRAEP